MISTFETLLQVALADENWLKRLLREFSVAERKAWVGLYRKKLTERMVELRLQALGLTSSQARSAIAAAKMHYQQLVEIKKHELKQLRETIKKQKECIKKKERLVINKTKQCEKLKKDIKRLKPAKYQIKPKNYLTALELFAKLKIEIKSAEFWIKLKKSVLEVKESKERVLDKIIESGSYSRCVGSAKLLIQRPNKNNQNTTPYKSVDAWRKVWDHNRNNQVWSIGDGSCDDSNPSIKYDPKTGKLRIRLTDSLVKQRIQSLGIPETNRTREQSKQYRECKWLEISNVSFDSHKGAAHQALLQAHANDKPMTMRIISRLKKEKTQLSRADVKNKNSESTSLMSRQTHYEKYHKPERAISPQLDRKYYLQVSVTLSPPKIQTIKRDFGVVGVDYNANRLAWVAVKADGNILKINGKQQRGFIYWNLKDKTTAKRKQIVSEAIQEIIKIALRFNCAIAKEILKFANKKAGLKVGYVNKTYNYMLSNLATSQFDEFMNRSCFKAGVELFAVNPCYSSVMGFAKYGRPHRLDADAGAAWWIARQALYGEIYTKKNDERSYVKLHKEKICFSKVRQYAKLEEPVVLATLPHIQVPKQSKKDLTPMKLSELAQALGRNRKRWGVNFHKFYNDYKVVSASGNSVFEDSESFESSNDIPPWTKMALAQERRDGFQSGNFSNPDQASIRCWND